MARAAQTTNFSYNYGDSLNAADKAAAIAHANALAATCENDLMGLDNMFGTSGEFGPDNRVTIVIENINAQGMNWGYFPAVISEVICGANRIDITPFTGAPDGGVATRAIFVAELA